MKLGKSKSNTTTTFIYIIKYFTILFELGIAYLTIPFLIKDDLEWMPARISKPIFP